MASNNWIISGKHTASGLPLLSSDPHLMATLPSQWTLIELRNGDDFVAGGSLPGAPGVAIGRTKNIVWGGTAALADNTDLWEEEISADGTKYLVDGEWREMKIRSETIKVKGKESVTI